MDLTPNQIRRYGIGITCPELDIGISANSPTARDSTQTELQTICLAILIAGKKQAIRIITNSNRAINAIQKTSQIAKHRVRRNYSTEIEFIQKTIELKQLKIQWQKTCTHSGTPENKQADQLA